MNVPVSSIASFGQSVRRTWIIIIGNYVIRKTRLVAKLPIFSSYFESMVNTKAEVFNECFTLQDRFVPKWCQDSHTYYDPYLTFWISKLNERDVHASPLSPQTLTCLIPDGFTYASYFSETKTVMQASEFVYWTKTSHQSRYSVASTEKSVSPLQ